MDIIKFNNPTALTKMERASIVNGLSTKTWIERYVQAGEFTFLAPVSSGMRTILPIGCFVSHIDTAELMIVENHEISQKKDSEPDIIITGRGYETFLENRIVGANKAFPVSGAVTDYTLAAAPTWSQVVALINEHIQAANLLDDNYELPYTSVWFSVTGPGTSVARTISRGTIYDRIQEIMSIDNLGIRVIRPGPWSPLVDPNKANVYIDIHKGVDRSNEVMFSNDTGEIESADYLWSNKQFKNAALVTGKWVEVVVNPAAVKYKRKMIYVNASDIDQDYAAVPVGANLTTVIAAMQQRGLEALASLNDVALTKAEISREAAKSVYRTDFNVGDLITVSGDFNEVSKMRVSEYVEIEDQNGQIGYPTLTMD